MALPLSSDAISGLIIVDMQEFFFRKPERRKGLEEVVRNINRLISHFEEKGMPIYHVVTRYQVDGSDWDLKMKAAGKPELIEGTPEVEILGSIKVSSEHTVMTKTRYSAFLRTSLAENLRLRGVERVVVVGAYTHYCVNATVFDAYGHDFVPCTITDAVASHLADEAAVMVDRMRRNGYHVCTTAEFLGGACGRHAT